MPAAVAAAARDLPELEAVIQDTSADEVRRLVESGAVDFGISNQPITDDRLLVRPLLQDPFCIVCRRDDPLAARGTVPWHELDGRDLVLPAAGSGSRRPIDEALARQSVTPRRVTGLADHPALATRPLAEPGAGREIVLVHRRDRSLSPAATAFHALIADRFGEPP